MNHQNCIQWEPAADAPPYSEPIPLAPHRELSVRIQVQADQVALVLRDGEVRGVLLEQGHVVRVRDDGEALDPDMSDKEVRVNLALENLHDELLGLRGQREFSHADSVLFLSVNLLPHLSLAEGGEASLRVDDPVLFYESFLRRTESLKLEDFTSVARALVEDGVDRGPMADPRHHAASRLRTIGIDLVALRVPSLNLA